MLQIQKLGVASYLTVEIQDWFFTAYNSYYVIMIDEALWMYIGNHFFPFSTSL